MLMYKMKNNYKKKILKNKKIRKLKLLIQKEKKKIDVNVSDK